MKFKNYQIITISYTN